MWQAIKNNKILLFLAVIFVVFGTPVTLRLIERNEHITIERIRTAAKSDDKDIIPNGGLVQGADDKDTRSLVDQYFNIKEKAGSTIKTGE